MGKAKLVTWLISIIMGCIALGIGVWYISSSIGGAAIHYSSLDGFLHSIGACSGGACDIANANGCFLCVYIEKLFTAIGGVTEVFWAAILENIWIVMAAGFGIFMFITAFRELMNSAKETTKLDGKEKTFDFKKWFDPVWKLGVRIMIAGVFLGAVGFGGTAVLKAVADIIIGPVMYIGSMLSMAASGISDAAMCGTFAEAGGIMGPVMQPFMCVIGNLNSVMLAGAASGFSLMNYAWLGLGGGLFTWIAGFGLVIMFLIIGFDLLFKILNVVFMLVFVIIFLPLFVAAAAFQQAWKMMDGLVSNIISMIVKCALKIVAISLNTVVIYTFVTFAADQFFPGPIDGYSAISIPGIAGSIGAREVSGDDKTATVANVFSKCEKVASKDGTVEMNTDAFRSCFVVEKAQVERIHPGAFDFMTDGWSFILVMLGLFLVYFYAVRDKVEKMLGVGKDSGGMFAFGTYIKELGTSLWNIPKKIGEAITKNAKK